MSKGRVWNQGKRNGGPSRDSKGKVPTKSNESIGTVEQTEAELAGISSEIDNPINSVKRMNRENWVVRPARELHKEPKVRKNNPSEEGSSSL